MSDINLITVLGPTASGKTSFSALLASRLNGEIVSADSRQVYKSMDIGTGKDLNEYIINGINIPYHLIDIHPAGYKYNVHEFQKDFFKAFHLIQSKKKLPILSGGTGMYIEAVLKNYTLTSVPENPSLRDLLKEKSLNELVKILKSKNPHLHNTTDLLDRNRTVRAIEIAIHLQSTDNKSKAENAILSLIFGIKFDRDLQKIRISDRLHARLEEGMIDEVSNLLHKTGENDLLFYGLEYKYITQYLINQMSYEDMVNRLEISIHQFAKRQMTWFRRMEKNGFKIHWIDGNLTGNEKMEASMKIIENEAPHLITTG